MTQFIIVKLTINLPLIGDRLDLNILGQIAARLEESPIPYQVDLSLWNRIDHARLLEHIQRVGVIFYHRSETGGNPETV
jgi:hypothetical protein